MIYRLLGLLFIALGLPAHPAYGSNYTDNRGLMPVGDVESFMANTGIALSGSTGAVFFNPAGLAGFTSNQISLSANAYTKRESEFKPLLTIDNTDLDFSASGIQAIPHSFITTWRTKALTFALSIIVPHQLKDEDVVSFSSPAYPVMQVARTNYFQLLMGGASAAARFANSYDIGVGCFYTMYQTSQLVFVSGNTNGAPNAAVSSLFYQADVAGILCNGGIQKQLSEGLRVGLSAQFPFMPLTKSGKASAFVQEPVNGVSVSEGPKSVPADYRIPLDIGLGFELRLASFWYLYLDVNHQFGERYRTGTLYEDEVHVQSTTRFNSGFRLRFSKNFQILAGAAYNPSSVASDSNGFRENFVVGTLGAHWLSGNSSFGLGFVGARSTGSGNVPVYSAEFAQIGRKSTSLRNEFYGVLVSSAYVF